MACSVPARRRDARHVRRRPCAGARAPPFLDPPGYARHRPEAALRVDELLPERPLRQWVLSLPCALRFLLATNPAALTQVRGVVHRTISDFLLRRAGLTRSRGDTGAVTLVQRCGSALDLSIHVHLLVLDGVDLNGGANAPVSPRPRRAGHGERLAGRRRGGGAAG